MAHEDDYHISLKAIIRNGDGDVLLIRATPDEMKIIKNIRGGYWDIPGGRLKVKEVPHEALLREIEEETGLTEIDTLELFYATISDVRLITPEGYDVGIVLSSYIASVAGSPEVTLSSEHESFQWCSPREAAKMLEPNFPKDFVARLAALR